MLGQSNTVSVRELKAKTGEILRKLEEAPGIEIVITRHGKPCAKLVSFQGKSEELPREEKIVLRNFFAGMHQLTDEDFAEAKRIWEPKIDAGR